MPDTPSESIRPPVCETCGYPTSAEPCERCHGEAVNRPSGRPIRPIRRFFLFDLAHGFSSLFRSGLRLVHRREFVGQLTLPILANVAAMAVTLLVFFLGFWTFFDGLTEGNWGWLEFLHGIASWASGVLSLVLAAITLFLVAPVIIEAVMSPFLDPIAETTEKLVAGPDMRAIERRTWASLVDSMRSAAQILTIQLAALIPLLLISLTGIGSLLAVSICALLNAVVWFDIPCGRRGYTLRDRILLIRHNWARALGFGLAFQAGVFLPFFNLFVLAPAAAISVSELYFHFEKPRARSNVPGPSAPPEQDPATP